MPAPASADAAVDGSAPATGGQVAWMKLWASLRDHPKWLPLGLEARGAWVTLALIACGAQPRRGEIASRAHALALLERDAPGGDAERLLDALLEVGLLDALSGGRIGLHDFDSWQVPPSHTKERNRERQQALRDRRRPARNKGSVVTNGARNKEREIERPPEERALYRDGAPALQARAPLDESDDAVDLDDVHLLLDPESAVHEEADRAWVSALAQRCLDELSPTLLIEAELVELQALASGASP